ncbi:MAG: phosphatase PAP2 family protein [Verrucomicrobia bacterium]|nr:phosphatase PAP2 family protein [Verrucomicrobiota bacterium]MDE3047374.1 phosphatase PAP2 family protein [Verrucomicrobiota bacterium]
MVDLANSRLEALDPFFRFLNYFDSPYFSFVLIPIVWLGYSYKWGLRLFYWIVANSLLIGVAKHLVGWPRPSTDMPEIGLFHPHSFGFPSGGAQTAMFLGSLLIFYWRTPIAWIVGVTYILLISFSRLYLGVHYPIDVLGGWCIGLILLALFVFCEKPLEMWLAKKTLPFLLLLSLIPPLVMLYFFPSTKYTAGSLIGVGLGTYFSLKHHLFLPQPKNLAEGAGRSAIGIAMLFLMVFLIPGKDTFLQSFISGLFMSLAASPICKWFVEKKRM